MYHEYFPPVIQALQEEIQKHPALLKNLLQLPKDCGIEMKLGEVAAFCGIILEGYYDNDQILELCDIFVTKLKHARAELIADISAPIITTH